MKVLSAIAICYEDPTVAAGIMNKFMKGAKALEFKAGVIEGTCYDAKGMAAVADIPSREVLLSKLLGSFKSPMGSFARVIKAIADQNGEATEETDRGLITSLNVSSFALQFKTA